MQDELQIVCIDTPKAAAMSMHRRIFSSEARSGYAPPWVQFTPQRWYLTHRSGDVIVIYICGVDTFYECTAEIAARLGIPHGPTHTNASKRSNTLSLSTPAHETLRRLYTADFQFYCSFRESVL